MFTTKDNLLLLLLLLPITVLGLGDKCENCLRPSHYQHYHERGCKPVMSPECNCPLYFKCPKIIPRIVLSVTEEEKLKKLGKNACIFNDKVYAINEELDVQCRVCQCRDAGVLRNVSGYMLRGNAYGECAEIECSELFIPEIESGCHRIFSLNECCSTGKICKNDPKADVKCQYKDRTFGWGEKIYLDEDPCKVYLCDEKFDLQNLENSTFYHLKCNIGQKIDDPRVRQQCTPVYFKNSCCSNGLICDENFDPERSPMKSLPENLTDKCILRDKEYKIGEKWAFQQHDTYRISFTDGECVCRVPPLMTCTYK